MSKSNPKWISDYLENITEKILNISIENSYKQYYWCLIHYLLLNNIGPSNKYIFRVGVGDILIMLTV
jgi:hypothetical protein